MSTVIPHSAFVARVLARPATGGQLAVRLVLFATLHLATAWLAVASRVPESSLSLVWPSAGVATFWLCTSSRRSLGWDTAVLAAAVLLSSVMADGDPAYALVRAAGTVGAALLFRVLVRRRSALGDTALGGGAIRSVATLGLLGAAAGVTGLLEAATSALALHAFEGEPVTWATLAHRWWRSWTAVFVFTVTGYLGLAALGRRVSTGEERTRRYRGLARRSQKLEALGVLVVTVAPLVLSMVFLPAMPVSFLFFVAAAWVGARFSPLVASLHALTTGLVVVACTLTGRGLFAGLESPAVSAFIAQAFVAVLFTGTVVLSLLSTRLRAAEQEAHSRAAVLDRVLATGLAGVFLVDDGGRVVLSNRAAARLLRVGTDVERVQDLRLDRLVRPDSSPLPPEELPHRRAMRGEVVEGEDLMLTHPSTGETRVLRFRAHCIESPDSRQEALVIVADATGEHEHTATLSAFAGEVAHDLKSPLAVVEGWGEMLQETFLESTSVPSSQGMPMVRRIQGATESMRTLIDELLSYTVARDRPLDLSEVDLARVAREAAAAHTQVQPGLLPPLVEVDVTHTVLADPLLLRQLLDNLVGNAVKYVAPGTVPHVRITSTLDSGRVRVEVSDNGLGVPVEHRERIFDRLYRVDRPGYAGTGLGLAICARIVARHESRLVLEDNPAGVGSAFAFTLAYSPTATAAERLEPAP